MNSLLWFIYLFELFIVMAVEEIFELAGDAAITVLDKRWGWKKVIYIVGFILIIIGLIVVFFR